MERWAGEHRAGGIEPREHVVEGTWGWGYSRFKITLLSHQRN